VIEELIPWDTIVGDLKQDASFDESDPAEAEEQEELGEPMEEPDSSEPPQDSGDLQDIANDSGAQNSTEPVAETPNGSTTYAVTPSLKPPTVTKLNESGESLFDDAREK
jgi:hypothetical protein